MDELSPNCGDNRPGRNPRDSATKITERRHCIMMLEFSVFSVHSVAKIFCASLCKLQRSHDEGVYAFPGTLPWEGALRERQHPRVGALVPWGQGGHTGLKYLDQRTHLSTISSDMARIQFWRATTLGPRYNRTSTVKAVVTRLCSALSVHSFGRMRGDER